MLNFIEPFIKVKNQNPLVQCITNIVTVNDCANILLASGASPCMAQDIREADDVVCAANALVCNMGAMENIDSMIKAGKKANELSIPVVLDPVAIGGSKLRRELGKKLLEEVHFSAIRGNVSEIMYIAGEQNTGFGVDAAKEDEITEDNVKQAIDKVKALAKSLNTVIAISGKLDVVSDGTHSIVIKNGCATMARVTGCGCMLTSLIGGFCGVAKDNLFEATVSAMLTMGIAGQMAEKKRIEQKTGNASFRTYLIDAVFNMQKEDIQKEALYELY